MIFDLRFTNFDSNNVLDYRWNIREFYFNSYCYYLFFLKIIKLQGATTQLSKIQIQIQK